MTRGQKDQTLFDPQQLPVLVIFTVVMMVISCFIKVAMQILFDATIDDGLQYFQLLF